MYSKRRLSTGLAILGLVAGVWSQDLWCGKVYTAGEPEVIPDGWLYPPSMSSTPLLDVGISPRHSIYVASEAAGEFIVDAALTYYRGQPYEGTPPATASDLRVRDVAAGDGELTIVIKVNCKTVATGVVAINTTDNLFSFLFLGLTPSTDPYPVTLIATTTTSGSVTTYTGATSLYFLPEKTTGSVVKIDNLYGSLLYRNGRTDGQFKYVFPYGFYGDYSGYFNVSANIEAYTSRGFNALNPVTSFVDSDMTSQIDTMDAVNLLWQYDMRGSFMNLTSVAEQVPLVRDHPSLLTYYTADEPDGWEYPLNSTVLAYELLARLDKYHPVALVLNCANYYFAAYAAGADIVMEDAYPVGINATYSYRGTPCNTTYGDCGCDDCAGSLLDVPERVDAFHNYAGWLGGAARRKPVWEVPQAFSGEGYWARDPTPQETWAMDVMSFNHGAKGRFAWIYPASDVLNEAAAELSKVVTVDPVATFLTQANPVLVRDATAKDGDGVDAAYWAVGGRVLVGVANSNDADAGVVKVELPAGVLGGGHKTASGAWGNTTWELAGSTLTSQGSFPGLGTSYIILQ